MELIADDTPLAIELDAAAGQECVTQRFRARWTRDFAPQREILEVLGTRGHRHYRVRWDDGHESIFFPGSDAIIQPARGARGTDAKPRP